MLGTSGCRLDDRREWGGEVLDWMLYAYALTYDSRQVIRNERDQCRTIELVSLVDTQIDAIVEQQSAGMTGRGKTFYWSDVARQPIASYPIRRIRDIPREEFLSRRIALSDPERAAGQAQALYPRAEIRVAENVVIVSHTGHSQDQMASIARTLDRFMGFLDDTYGIAPPDYFLSIHLVESQFAVSQMANTLHGLDVSAASVGYAFVDDGSVVGAVRDTAVGTIFHELFHLLVRSGFGDVPQWLDEGIASLYEVSGRSADTYFGLVNWRGRVLELLWNERPSVEELIRSEWFLFDDPEQLRVLQSDDLEGFTDYGEGRDQAAVMAMARYFLLYLEQRGELVNVYTAIRDRGFSEIDGPAREHAVRLVEETLGRTTAELDAEFSDWFRNTAAPGISPDRVVLTSGAPVYAATANVNIRSGPSTANERLGGLTPGQVVAVFDVLDDWLEIHIENGLSGYVHRDYLAPAGN
jgi:hypothetical protein